MVAVCSSAMKLEDSLDFFFLVQFENDVNFLL